MKKTRLNRTIRFLSSFIAAYLICIAVTAVFINNKSQMEYVQMEQLMQTRASKVSDVLTKLLYKTQALSALVIQNNGEIEDFDRVAATILDDPAIKNVILAPGGVVSNVYPLEDNEQVLGLDYFSEGAGNLEAILARDSGQLVLGGPFQLVQGGQALVGRLPVSIKDDDGVSHFWGLVSVTLYYPEALAGAELDQLKEQGFAYEIWRINPDTNEKQIISNSNYNYNPNAAYVEEPFTVLNAQWFFRVSPLSVWYEFPETWIFLCLGLLISMLFAYLVLYNYDLRQMQGSLENLTNTDPLTGVNNRRGFFNAAETFITKDGAPFALGYVDLNNFKSVNDTYGHTTGDELLVQVSEVFLRRLRTSDLFGRIGGDEFVLICRGSDGEDRLKKTLELVREDLSHLSVVSNHSGLVIGFSAGWAVYPEDGDTVDRLLICADDAMYQNKASEQSS